jgi:cytochrome c-type biogenesis protein CcmH
MFTIVALLGVKLPLRRVAGERVAPIAKQWEGEVVPDATTDRRLARRRPTSPSPRYARVPSLSPRCAGGEGFRAWRALVLLLALFFSFPALAVEPSEVLSDPALEARAREIGQALRCVVCQNQSIDDSAAEVAHDMRRAVRDRLSAGDSNDQVFAYMVARYGDYVLLKPPFKTGTLVLWLGAPLLLLIAGGALLLAARRRHRAGLAVPQPLSDEERQRLDTLLKP